MVRVRLLSFLPDPSSSKYVTSIAATDHRPWVKVVTPQTLVPSPFHSSSKEDSTRGDSEDSSGQGSEQPGLFQVICALSRSHQECCSMTNQPVEGILQQPEPKLYGQHWTYKDNLQQHTGCCISAITAPNDTAFKNRDLLNHSNHHTIIPQLRRYSEPNERTLTKSQKSLSKVSFFVSVTLLCCK